MSEIFSAEIRAGVGVFGGNLGRGPPHCCASSFPAITPADPRPVTNTCKRFEDQQKMFFPLVDPRPPLSPEALL